MINLYKLWLEFYEAKTNCELMTVKSLINEPKVTTMKFDLNELAKEIHQVNVAAGWWVDMNRDVYQCLQLVSTELAEATEGERKNLMDDHLPHRKMGEVELADALIRLLDLAGRYGWKYYGDDVHNHLLDQMTCVAGGHFICNVSLVNLGESLLLKHSPLAISSRYTTLINTILKVGEIQGYDVFSAMFEKIEYNKHRADHKPAARADINGKKF